MSFPDSPGVALWNANSCYLAASLQLLLLQGAVVAWLLLDLPEELPQETKVIRALRAGRAGVPRPQEVGSN